MGFSFSVFISFVYKHAKLLNVWIAVGDLRWSKIGSNRDGKRKTSICRGILCAGIGFMKSRYVCRHLPFRSILTVQIPGTSDNLCASWNFTFYFKQNEHEKTFDMFGFLWVKKTFDLCTICVIALFAVEFACQCQWFAIANIMEMKLPNCTKIAFQHTKTVCICYIQVKLSLNWNMMKEWAKWREVNDGRLADAHVKSVTKPKLIAWLAKFHIFIVSLLLLLFCSICCYRHTASVSLYLFEWICFL